MALMLNNKGVLFMEQNQYTQARRNFHRALQLAELGSKKNRSMMMNARIQVPTTIFTLDPSQDDASRISTLTTNISTFKPRKEYQEGMDHYVTFFRVNDVWQQNIDSTFSLIWVGCLIIKAITVWR